MTHNSVRRLGLLACLTAIVVALGGCSGLSTASAAASALPDGIPTPSEAAVVVGQDGGYDAGARLFAFSSNLGPADAIRRYEAQLTAAGFEPAGSSGTWTLYRNGVTLLAIRAGESGPPTDLLVRVMAGSPTASGIPETAGGAAGNGNSTGGAPNAGNGGANQGHGGPGAAGGNSSNAANGTGGGNSDPAGNGGGSSVSAGGNAGSPGGNSSASPNPKSNAGGNSGASPNPNSNAGGNSGASPNPKAPDATPVPRPDPPNGRPSAPPGQVKATTPAAIRTASPHP